MAKKRIGILTGGGDVPGLNSVIKSVVYRGAEIGCDVIGIRRGWEGLTHVDLKDPASKARYVLPLNRENTRTIDRTGGTFIHSSRTNPAKMKKLPPVLQGQDFEATESTQEGCDQHRIRCNPSGAEQYRGARPGLSDRHWRRRHAELCRQTRSQRHEGDRGAEDDGQRRPQHGVLHRILNRDYACHGCYRPTAYHGRLARAHWHLPGVWPRCRLHCALHGIRYRHPLLHSRV